MSLDSLRLKARDKPLPGAAPPDNGLGGRLAVRTPPRGGWGNALILIVFLRVFPAVLTPGLVLSFGSVVLPPGDLEGALRDVDGARSPLFGILEASGLKSETVGILPVLFRVLFIGNAGNADVGGPYDGRAGRGIAAAMIRKYDRNTLLGDGN